MAELPVTRYARVGGDQVAYQVLGDGPVDLMWMSGIGDCMDVRWEYPPFAAFLRRLASFSRLILFDRRGVGASDPVRLDGVTCWEEWTHDAIAVLDAVDSEQACLLGANDAGTAAILFAAVRPERTRALILANTSARSLITDDYPWGTAPAEQERMRALVADLWGTEEMAAFFTREHADDEVFLRWNAKNMRLSCSRREMSWYMRQANESDVRHILPSIRAPSLVVHRSDAPFIAIEHGRYLAEHLPEARLAVVPGGEVTIYMKPNTQILDVIEEFVTGTSPVSGTRALAAILFTDIVGSTERAAALGDRWWRSVLDRHDSAARAIVDRYGGRIVKLTGDGMLATFDGPGRAIHGALALGDELTGLGLGLRAGLHVGEVEVRGEDIGGIGVHVAARVLGRARPGEVLASAVVPLLVAGSGIEFADRGEHELKGLPGIWRLFTVEG